MLEKMKMYEYCSISMIFFFFFHFLFFFFFYEFFLNVIYRLIFRLNIENVRVLNVWIIHIGISVLPVVNLRVTGHFKNRIFYSQDIVLLLFFLLFFLILNIYLLLNVTIIEFYSQFYCKCLKKFHPVREMEKRILLQDIYNLK